MMRLETVVVFAGYACREAGRHGQQMLLQGMSRYPVGPGTIFYAEFDVPEYVCTLHVYTHVRAHARRYPLKMDGITFFICTSLFALNSSERSLPFVHAHHLGRQK
jgi:hypothetical protein